MTASAQGSGQGPATGVAEDSGHLAYEPVIGLEIHVQLKTRTKMFCGCELSFGDPPNTHTCPVCLGLPGSLPVANAQAVHFGLMIGMALDSELAPRSIFHRKNYFYPDLPKGYQISQYDEPLCLGGSLAGVRIHRVHLEEDAAKLIHLGASGRIHGSEVSVVDFNRGGTPLVEIVTEPDLHSPAQAREWLELLRATLRALGVSDVNMEEGSLRADANVSLRPRGSDTLGTKAELKNMNSFRYLERGVAAEIERQREIIESGGAVVQETLHFDPSTGALTSLRSKEEAQDYRYFPEPDLVPIATTEAMLETAREAMPELPSARAERLEREHGLSAERAHQLAFRGELGDFFEAAVAAERSHPRRLSDWVGGELVARLDEREPAQTELTPAALAALVALVESGKVTAAAAREVLDVLIAEGGDPAAVVAARGLETLADEDGLAEIVARAIAADPAAAEQVRSGNAKAIGALIGPIMRETRGRADGNELTRLIRAALAVKESD
jgi:aspartyl-tRNA(Asn)/glutamyl-tRNA(Gln) amidotransferase subunit B